MKPKIVLLSMVCIILAVSSACTVKDSARGKGGGVLASVNGTAITEDDLYLRLQGGHAGSVTPAIREQALQELIDEELLYQKGLKLGLDKDAKYRNAVMIMEARMKAFKRAEMARRMRGTTIAATVNVTNDDVKKYYTEHEATISTDLHLFAIRYTDGEQARLDSEKIKSGTSFEALARQKYPPVPKGKTAPWDMGFLRWNQIPMEWMDAVYALKAGEVSDVLSSQRSGTYIVKLVDRRRNSDTALERMSANIMNRLVDMRGREAYDQYMEKLKREARIVKPEERRNPS